MPRRSSTGSWAMTSRPSTSMVPEVGSIRRLIIFMVVVLPHPDGPTSTTVSPRPMSSDRSATAAPPPPGYSLLTSFREIMTSDTARAYPASLGLKASNGFRHDRQKWVDRQSVGPKALSSSVSSLPQKGHAAPSARDSD